MDSKEFVIIGGGIAGLTTAIALSRIGVQAKVYEAAPEIRAIGAGLALASNAMRGFDRLGLLEEVSRLGRLLPEFVILDSSGKSITKADDRAINPKDGLGNFLIHRAKLHDFLRSKLDPNQVYVNKRAIGLEKILEKTKVKFADGTSVVADYLFVADGVHSAIRKQLVPESFPRYAGYTCWRGVIDNASLGISCCSETWGAKGRFGIGPLADDRLYWFACVNAPQNSPEMARMTVGDLLERFSDYHDPVPQILSAAKGEELIWNDIIDLKPIPHLAFGNIVLLGDAAHATTPNLGQGACQAIEDAVILADEMSGSADYRLAFKAFEKRRLKRVHFIVDNSWKVGKVAQLENATLVKIRNFVFRNLPRSVNEKQIMKVLSVDF